ncbi:MAG: preprotein translocase subunit YajC [Planctomycetes bacterium]|jgi:preprotein translocase subunit YajC|nr:preprotein translocase subunit YajC [Planctomycetota bacterium]
MQRLSTILRITTILLVLTVSAAPALAQDDGGGDEGQWVGQPAENDGDAPAPADDGSADKATESDGGDGANDDTEGQGDQAQDKSPSGGPFSNMWFMVIMIGGFILLYWVMGSSRRKQAAKRREMLANLAKGDKIITIGGVVGTAVEVRDDEITVKVDDGTRMKFARWAIRSAGEEVASEKKDDAEKK